MRLLALALSMVIAGSMPAAAQRTHAATATGELELRPVGGDVGQQLELLQPDVASGRSQRRPITDLMLQLVLPGGDIVSALRLPNGASVDRDAGLFGVRIYIVSGGRLLAPAEARCDRWLDDLAVCRAACEGGAFGLKRRGGQGRTTYAMVNGRLPRGLDENARPGFSLSGCESDDGQDLILAPSGSRPLVEIALRAK